MDTEFWGRHIYIYRFYIEGVDYQRGGGRLIIQEGFEVLRPACGLGFGAEV